MEDPNDRDFTAEDNRSQVSSRQKFRFPPKPQVVSELLTLRAACARYGVSEYQIYLWSNEEPRRLHPVRVKEGSRTLYPDFELAELAKGRQFGRLGEESLFGRILTWARLRPTLP